MPVETKQLKLLVLLTLLSSFALAEMPHLISYQGALRGPGGILLPDGDYPVTFRLYDAASEGQVIWTEVQLLHVDVGIFSANLGSVTPLTLAFDQPYWISVEVDGVELLPALPLTAAPYAMRALTAAGASLDLPFSGSASTDEGTSLLSVTQLGAGSAGTFTTTSNGPAVEVRNDSPYGSNVAMRVVNQPGGGADTGAAIQVSSSGMDWATGAEIYGTSEGVAVQAGPGVGAWSVCGVNSQASAGYNSQGGSPDAIGVYARGSLSGTPTGEGEAVGLWALAETSEGLQTGHGLIAEAIGSGINEAGTFYGDVSVSGTLSKGAGSFKIDHPLDPANRYLYHSFVESPDMKNIYDGNVRLDATGGAWVELPEWFGTLNRDFRYQLTAIGAAAPNLHIATPVAANRFEIAGGQPGMEVSWQVTGIRQDPFANANRIPVEVDKPERERGTYLHPEARGLPASAGLAHRVTSSLRRERPATPEVR